MNLAIDRSQFGQDGASAASVEQVWVSIRSSHCNWASFCLVEWAEQVVVGLDLPMFCVEKIKIMYFL